MKHRGQQRALMSSSSTEFQNKKRKKSVLFSDSVLFCQPAAAKLPLCVWVCQRGRSPPWNLCGGCWRGRRDQWSVWKVQRCRSAIKVASSKNRSENATLEGSSSCLSQRGEGVSFYCHVKSKAVKHEKTERVKVLLSNRCVSLNLTEINFKHITTILTLQGHVMPV